MAVAVPHKFTALRASKSTVLLSRPSKPAAENVETKVYHPFWVVEVRDLNERSVPCELAPDEDHGGALAGRWGNSHELRVVIPFGERGASAP